MMLALILVGVLNVPLTVTEVGVGNPESQILNGDDLEPFSVAEDPWNFSNIVEWSHFAYFNGNSAEVVIGLRNTKTQNHAKLSSLVCEGCGEIVNTVSMGGEVRAVVADIPSTSVSSFVTEIRATGLSRYIEPNIKFQANFVPNDPYWSQQWGPRIIEADYAWNITIGDPSVLVAVIDTGIDYNHPDLAGNYVALGYDWVNDDADPRDDNGHGTHCAGIIAATLNNGIGIAGVAQVQIMAQKGLDSGGSGKASDLANAIIHAVDQGADILSNSWGGYSYSNLMHDAVKYAKDNGVLVVAAAGNDASSMKHYPAAYDEVVTVTATDQTDDPASFTSYGKWVDIAAPGVDVYSTVLNERYENHSGTSMACPHAAGVAALIWSEFPSLTRDEVRLRLQLTADDLGDPGFDVYYGYGRVNARRAVEPLPSHDILIFNWKRPAYSEPGSSAIINTTVVNFGSSNEAGITVQLRVNGSMVDSAYISYLRSMRSVTVSCTWSPTVEGRYLVESYVVPVSGETSVENNVRSAYINVRIGKFIKVPEDCSKIQEAADLANPGETINVASGTYYERVGIDVPLKLFGEDRNTTVIDGNGIGTVVGVTADSVVVRGFTVQNSGDNLPNGGIVLSSVKNCEVTNNTLINNFEGVLLWGCTGNNSVYDNIAFSNEDAGVGSVYSTGSDTISDNAITGGQFGIIIVAGSKNIVSRNVIANSEYGVSIAADDNTVVNNTITSCTDHGIGLSFSGNTIRDNRVENNERGIVMEGASSNNIYNNDLIHNTVQVYFIGSPDQNTWDDSYPSGGNHWSDYTGVDANQDGIGDTPYVLGTDNVDRYPLMRPLLTPFYGPQAKFTHSPTTQYVNKTVTFNASSSTGGWNGTARVSIANYTWNFGDGNVATVTNPVILHNYATRGTYTVNLTVACRDDPVLIAEGLASDSTLRDMRIILPPPPEGPTAKFDYWTHIPYINDTVTFYASASVPGYNGTHNVPIANYTWNFGDGNTTTTTTPVIEHTYAYNTTYRVNLTVICQDDPVLIAEGLTSDSTWQNIEIRMKSPLPPLITATFQDNFESYNVGTFPSTDGWEWWWGSISSGWGDCVVKVVDNTLTKSLKVAGWSGTIVHADDSCPIAAKKINTNTSTIGFEVWVKSLTSGLSGENTLIGFLKKISQERVEWYVKVSFKVENYQKRIYANDQFMQSYVADRWHKIRVIADKPTGNFSVWIDDVLKGENLTAYGNLCEIEAFGLGHCMDVRKPSYFDEAKIFKGPFTPTARFDFCGPTPLFTNDTVIFNASSSSLGWNGTAYVPLANYTWNFGDGNTTTTTNPIITHIYKAAGPYTVNLTVTCDDPVLFEKSLAAHSKWQRIDIKSPSIPPPIPLVDIDFSPTIPYVNDTVFFSSRVEDDPSLGWTSTGGHEIVIDNLFKYSGDYSGRLRSNSWSGHSWKAFTTPVSSGNVTVVFWIRTSAHGFYCRNHYFGVSDGPGSIGYRVGIQRGGDYNNYIGWICNGTFHPITQFPYYPWYKIELRINLDQKKYSIYINNELKVAEAYPNGTPSKVDYFDVSFDHSNYESNVAWIDLITVTTASGNIVFAEDFEYFHVSIVSYEWDFGDGSCGEGMTVNHTYTTFGTYNVTLTVTNRGGATGTKWRTVTVIILGDINGDGVVDSTDQGILGMAWGSIIGEPNYIPEADLNGDGVVDSTDYGILGANWGHPWS